MSRKVLVLGCGPAGLMAVHAANLAGCSVVVVSKPRKSYMKGAQFLHQPIPVASSDSPFRIKYRLDGGSEGDYRFKVYGSGYRGKVSPEDFVGDHDAWDIREAYDWLWGAYGSAVLDGDFSDKGETLSGIIRWFKPEIVISTIPATLLCMRGCSFTSQYIWSSDEPMRRIEENTILCNAAKFPAWYRAARIQGHDTVEWPDFSRPPIPNLHHVQKPLANNCVCWPGIVRMGRYGKWEKGVLSHTAFFETQELLAKPFQEELF